MPKRQQTNQTLPTAITQRDIADRCGVHVSTVSMALRNDPRLRKDTIERIQAVADEMGYDQAYFDAARRMVLRVCGKDVKNHTVAVIMPPHFLYTTFFSVIYRSLITELTENGYAALTATIQFESITEKDMDLPSALGRGDVDGLVAFGHRKGVRAVVERLRKMAGFGSRPIVITESAVSNCHQVYSDDEHGAYLAVKHLLDLGHEHVLQFVHTGYPLGHDEPRSRVNGVRQALREYRLDPATHLHLLHTPPAWVIPFASMTAPYPSEQETDRSPLLALLDAHPEITAILAVNDPSANHIWQILEQFGRSVPGDISLIGFDDTDPVLDKQGANVLTSVRLPLDAVGREAARVMLRQLGEDAATDAFETIALPVELIIRQSTGPAPCKG